MARARHVAYCISTIKMDFDKFVSVVREGAQETVPRYVKGDIDVLMAYCEWEKMIFNFADGKLIFVKR